MFKDYVWFIYSLTAAALWGIHYATAGEVSKNVPAFVITIFYLVFVTIFSIIVLLIVKSPTLLITALISHINLTTLWQLGIMGITGSISNFLIFSAIADSTATKASIVEITYPLFVALFSLILYGENTLNLKMGIGGILIFLGVTMVMRS